MENSDRPLAGRCFSVLCDGCRRPMAKLAHNRSLRSLRRARARLSNVAWRPAVCGFSVSVCAAHLFDPVMDHSSVGNCLLASHCLRCRHCRLLHSAGVANTGANISRLLQPALSRFIYIVAAYNSTRCILRLSTSFLRSRRDVFYSRLDRDHPVA